MSKRTSQESVINEELRHDDAILDEMSKEEYILKMPDNKIVEGFPTFHCIEDFCEFTKVPVELATKLLDSVGGCFIRAISKWALLKENVKNNLKNSFFTKDSFNASKYCYDPQIPREGDTEEMLEARKKPTFIMYFFKAMQSVNMVGDTYELTFYANHYVMLVMLLRYLSEKGELDNWHHYREKLAKFRGYLCDYNHLMFPKKEDYMEDYVEFGVVILKEDTTPEEISTTEMDESMV